MLSIASSIQDIGPQDESTLTKSERANHFFTQAIISLQKQNPTCDESPSILVMEPSLIHCQVLTILALQQHGIAAFSQAGLLCGVATTMATDLKLHRRSDLDSSTEVEIKSRLWWGIYVLEKMLSCEMSRPTILRLEESDTPFPSVEESDEFELYSGTAYGSHATSQKRFEPLKLRIMSAFHTSIKLTMIMEDISRQIYSVAARQRIRDDRQYGEETRLKLWAQLQAWESMMQTSQLKLDISDRFSSVPVTVLNYVVGD
jgi:hypothetical protein